MNVSFSAFGGTAIVGIFVAAFGLLWGSFLNVCILRIPSGKDVFLGRSHCPHCNTLIPWFFNVPVLSYLWLRGQCHVCKGRISVQYPLVELITAVLFVWLYVYFGWTFRLLAYGLFHSLLLVISIIDLHHRIIPDELSLVGMVVGFLFSFLLKDILWWESLLGILLGGGSFLLVAVIYEKMTKREGLGGGDIKLLGMIGAWLGYKSVLVVILFSTALGSLIGVTIMVVQRGNLKMAIPFGPFLALAAFAYSFFGKALESFLYLPMP